MHYGSSQTLWFFSAKVAGILAHDAYVAIEVFVVRHKAGLIWFAKRAGLFAAGLYCGILLRGGNIPPVPTTRAAATHLAESGDAPVATPANAASVPANQAFKPVPIAHSGDTSTRSSRDLRADKLATDPKRKPHAARLAHADNKPARRLTLVEFRQKLADRTAEKASERTPTHNSKDIWTGKPIPVASGGATLCGSDLVKAFGQPDRTWTETDQEVQHSILEGGPIPVTGIGPVENTYTYPA